MVLTSNVGRLISASFRTPKACSARAHGAQQERIAAATLAKYKERDRYASWLERRLKEVGATFLEGVRALSEPPLL